MLCFGFKNIRTTYSNIHHSQLIQTYPFYQNNFDKDSPKVNVGKKRISSLLNASVTRQNQELENY